jgi:hypothetical protein
MIAKQQTIVTSAVRTARGNGVTKPTPVMTWRFYKRPNEKQRALKCVMIMQRLSRIIRIPIIINARPSLAPLSAHVGNGYSAQHFDTTEKTSFSHRSGALPTGLHSRRRKPDLDSPNNPTKTSEFRRLFPRGCSFRLRRVGGGSRTVNLARTAATAFPAQLVAAAIPSRLPAEVSAKHALIISKVDSNAIESRSSNRVSLPFPQP